MLFTTYPRRATHSLGHLLVAPEGLYTQADRLQLGPHLIEFLYISTRADEVLSHDLAGILRIGIAAL